LFDQELLLYFFNPSRNARQEKATNMARSLSPGSTTVAGVSAGRIFYTRMRTISMGSRAAVDCAPSSSIVRTAWVTMIRFSWARSLIKARTAGKGVGGFDADGGGWVVQSFLKFAPPDATKHPRDLSVPEVTKGEPVPRKRVLQALPDYENSKVRHALYLSTDWVKGKNVFRD
jgi:hypothetical protein